MKADDPIFDEFLTQSRRSLPTHFGMKADDLSGPVKNLGEG